MYQPMNEDRCEEEQSSRFILVERLSY